MAQPRPYERDYDFTSFQVRHATTPPPGNKLDAEFDQIAATIDEVLLRIKDLQRDDLQLANFIVGYDQLKPELRNGFTTPTVWKTATRYAIGASIYVGPKVYAALVAHTSGVFAADLSAGKWYLLADFTIVAGAVQTAVDAAAAAAVSAQDAADSAFTASTAAMNAQALLDTIDVNDVTTLAAISADISAAVANAADISTVAGVVSDIPPVAGIAADVATVAGIAADVTAAAANMAAIIAAPDAAEAAAESAQAAADIAATLAGVVVGPATSVDGHVVVFDGETGELVKDSGVAVSNVVTKDGTQTLTNKTLTQPVLTLKQSATPTPTAEGDIQWDTDDNVLAIGDGAATKLFLPIPASTAAGDIEYFTAAKVKARLAKGTAAQVLQMNAGATAPEWVGLGAAAAALAYGAVGTYVFGYVFDTGLIANATIAGSSIEPAGVYSSTQITPDDGAVTPTAFTKGGAALSGTWRIMGQANNTTAGNQSRSTLFLRIA